MMANNRNNGAAIRHRVDCGMRQLLKWILSSFRGWLWVFKFENGLKVFISNAILFSK